MADEAPRVGVGVLVLRDGRVLLGERRGAHGAGSWAPPGGHLEFGETPEQCARRELLEETGLELGTVEAGPTTNDFFEAEGLHYVTLFVVAREVRGEPAVLEPTKCVRWSWFRWNELPAPLFRPVASLVRSGWAPPHAAGLQVGIAAAADRVPLQRMLELYQHDLSDIWDQDLDAHGEFGYGLDRYFGDPRCRAYVARLAGAYAGFALVDDAVKLGPGGWWMDQFFVMKKYRRRGIGQALAARVFAELAGSWEVGQMPDNHAARAFWRRVIGACTAGRYEERVIAEGWWQGTVQLFVTRTQGVRGSGSAGPLREPPRGAGSASDRGGFISAVNLVADDTACDRAADGADRAAAGDRGAGHAADRSADQGIALAGVHAAATGERDGGQCRQRGGGPMTQGIHGGLR